MKKNLLVILRSMFCFVFYFMVFMIAGCGGKATVSERPTVSVGTQVEQVGQREAQKTQAGEPDFDYVNEKFSFALNFPEDYKIEYLQNDSGVLIKKWFEYEDPKKGVVGYKTEIVILPFGNLMEFESLSDFIVSQYPDYSVEFTENGVFVNEGVMSDAIRHFFRMSDDKKTIYEAYLKCPSVRYNEHKEFFDKIVAGMKIF